RFSRDWSSDVCSSDLGQTLGRAALALAVVTALLSLTPLAATWRRWRLRRGRGPAEQVEGEWAVLVTGLADLGIEPPRAATPRGKIGRAAWRERGVGEW